MEGLSIKATAKVTLRKLDENGNLLSVEESEVELTEEEARELWHSQPQE